MKLQNLISLFLLWVTCDIHFSCCCCYWWKSSNQRLLYFVQLIVCNYLAPSHKIRKEWFLFGAAGSIRLGILITLSLRKQLYVAVSLEFLKKSRMLYIWTFQGQVRRFTKDRKRNVSTISISFLSILTYIGRDINYILSLNISNLHLWPVSRISAKSTTASTIIYFLDLFKTLQKKWGNCYTFENQQLNPIHINMVW